MEKKLVLVLLMATLLAGGAFAQISLSAGFGGTFTANFMNAAWTSDGEKVLDYLGWKKDYLDTNLIGGGFFAYFDATYVMASLGMGFYGITPANNDQKKAMDDAKTTLSLATFDISVFGKYPIPIGAATLFPMLGVNFKIAVAQDTTVNGKRYTYADNNNGRSVSEYMSSVWFKLGLGADIPLGEKFYLRPMFLYGIGTLPKSAQNQMDYYNSGTKLFDTIYHGLDVNIAVGYKF